MEKTLYLKLSNERAPEFNIVTSIVERDGQRLVRKAACQPEGQEHLKRVFDAYNGLKALTEGSAFGVNQTSLIDGVLESEFLEGCPIGPEQAKEYVEAVTAAYLPHASEFEMTPEFEKVFGQVNFGKGVLASKYVDIDLIFENIIATEAGWQIIDFEWTFDFPIPINYILWRAEKFCPMPAGVVNIPQEERVEYQKMESHFQYEYCFKGVYNLKEIREHALENNAKNAGANDLLVASKDYQIKRLQELVDMKETHIQNIEEINRQLKMVYETKGYKMLEKARRVRDFFTGKSNGQPKAKDNGTAAKTKNVKPKAVSKNTKKTRQNGPGSIAVHLHLFYVDLLPEFVEYFSNIPYQFDLYISCQKGADVSAIKSGLKSLKRANSVNIVPVENRGRDLAPLYVTFGQQILEHDYFLHVHSKKSFYSGKEKVGWRQYSLSTLLGSEETVNHIFELFDSKHAGLIYPDIQEEIPTIAYSWLQNEANGKQLLEELGIDEFPTVFNYPAGSFFWARTEALKPLFTKGITLSNFPEEAGQTDGTLAHALERVLPFVSRKLGYDDVILCPAREAEFINKSMVPFENYFKVDKELLTLKLSAYDVISFDIFDTLFTRCILEPDQVFDMMSILIKEKYGKTCDFKAIRKRAEAEATAIYGNKTQLDQIYLMMQKDKTLGNLDQQLKQMEIDLEYKLCVPRKDMVDIFNSLKGMGKTVILVSDMYLNRNQITAMLHKCKIAYYDELLVSSETGLRKDTGEIWDYIRDRYRNLKFIHVGDNFRSDSQNLMDRGMDSHIVLSPKVEMELSDFADLSIYGKGNVANSLALGAALAGGIFNSPFAYGKEDLKAKFLDGHLFGYTTMGPLLAGFVQWLADQSKEEEKLLLLTREGFMFERLLDAYTKSAGIDSMDYEIFYASRRAVSVPSLKNHEDLMELSSQNYEGSLSNFLEQRFGLPLHDGQEDLQIEMSATAQEKCDLVAPYMEELGEKVKAEREAYLRYFSSKVNPRQKVSVVDVGFSGTIQYFLMKLTGNDIGGYYLCIHSNKPEKLGGKALALYNLAGSYDMGSSKILRQQLFLEAVLSDSSGQLISFSLDEAGNPVPSFKEKEVVNPQVKAAQQGILEYTALFGKLFADMPKSARPSIDLLEDIFYDIVSAGLLSEDVAREFEVEDFYSSAGVRSFDANTGTWKVN